MILDAATDGPDGSAVFGELDYENPKTGAVEMGFLKSVVGSNHNKTWTLTLHPGLKFSDGTPFDAAAIEYNYQRDSLKATASPFQPITSTFKMKVVSKTALKITVPTSQADFPSVIAESLAAIGSPTAMKSEGANFGLKPVGAGPFEVSSYTPGQTVTMTANPNYKLFAPGQPYLSGLKFTVLPDATSQANALKEGEGQIGETLGLNDLNTFKKDGMNVYQTIPSGGESLWLNNAIPPFNSQIAREAFTLAVNRAAIASGQLPGTHPINNLFQTTSPYYNKKYNFPAQNKAKAQQLFNELAKQGHPFNFTYTTVPTARGQQLGATLQSELSAYKNVTVHIQTVPLTSWSTNERSSNYEGIIEDMFAISPMPIMENTFAAGGSLNTFKWNNPTVTSTLKKIEGTTNKSLLKKYYGIVQQQFLKDDPVYFAAQGLTGFETTKNITGVHVVDAGEIPLWGELGYTK
jgi:ABC-type transport system substrate-binding protein